MEHVQTPVAVAFISDDGYVMPTCVAITSLIESKHPETICEIHIVCASLSEESQSIFRRFESDTVHIHIICQSADRFAGLHVFQEGSFCVATPAALLKLVLPELLAEYDRVLYLDGDLLVREDLTDLFHTDLGDAYLAAVTDSGVMYRRSKFIDQVPQYFNSGVMLLNLEQMRKDNLPETLIRTKAEMQDSTLMDQNVLNCVCSGRTVPLPIRYNFLPINLLRAAENWTLEQLNALYGTQYPDEASLFADAAILHFASKDKPWKDDTVAFADDWYHCYYRAPIEHPLTRSHPAALGSGVPNVSVILPQPTPEALDAIRNQTLQDVEILSDFRQAKGSYLWFADGCLVTDPDALAHCTQIADANGLDVLLFEDADHRKIKFYPSVCSGQEMLVQLSRNEDCRLTPGSALYRRDYLRKQQLRFPEGSCLPGECFAFQALIQADRVKALCYAPCRQTGPSGTGDAYRDYVNFRNTAGFLLDILARQTLEEDAVHAAALQVNRLLSRANTCFLQLSEEQKISAQQAARTLDDALLAPILALHTPSLFPSDREKLQHYRSECSQLRVEKAARWEELQTLYKEKGQRWQELQALKKEKGERWQELQALKKEKAERWQELQALKKENAALRQELNACKKANRSLISRILSKIAAIFKKGA